MTQFTKRVSAIDISGIRKMFEGAGPNAINMGLGQPDFDTPENIKAAAVAALAAGKTGYTNNAGLDELREAVAAKLVRENNLACEAKNVIITAGGSGALNIAIQALVEDGDSMIPALSPTEHSPHLRAALPARSGSVRTSIWTWKHSKNSLRIQKRRCLC